MSRSRWYPGPSSYRYDYDARLEHRRAAALRADLPEQLAEYEHHARWSTAPEYQTILNYADEEAAILMIASAKLAHHRGRRRSVAYRNLRASHRAAASNNKSGRLEPADPRVVVRTSMMSTLTVSGRLSDSDYI